MAEVRLRLSGIGGQGIVFAGRLLSQAMVEAGKYVSLRYAYGAEVMGTPVHSELVFSDAPILCPFFRKAQVAVVLHPRALPEALEGIDTEGLLVLDSAIPLEGIPARAKVEVRPFVAVTAKGRPGDPGRLAPVAALGFLAKLGFFPLDPVFSVARAGRQSEENLSALRRGYEL